MIQLVQKTLVVLSKVMTFLAGLSVFAFYLGLRKPPFLPIPDLNQLQIPEQFNVSSDNKKNEYIRAFKETFQSQSPFSEFHDTLGSSHSDDEALIAYYSRFSKRIRANELNKESCSPKNRIGVVVKTRFILNDGAEDRVFQICSLPQE